MHTPAGVAIDPWRLELVVVGASARTSTERAAISRDVERGRLLRVIPRAYVERDAFESLSPEQQHLVRIRAASATAPEPLVVSHWSAAVLHGLPVLRSRLLDVHVVVSPGLDRRRAGLAFHALALSDAEVTGPADLRATTLPRTVVDVASATALEEGVLAVSAALMRGIPREVLESAADRAAERRGSRRIADAVAMGHPGAESAAESRAWVSLMRSGFAVPELQHEMHLSRGGRASLDALLRRERVGIEVDGEQKYLDPSMAPDGAGRAVLREKRREDEVRLGLRALVRPGWQQSGSASAMRALLGSVGVVPTNPPTPFAAYCEAARAARPRPLPR
ncbi:hypothetical protein [Amnibacterium kyonggiense]|uniref:Transcriptional regulator, AbiEi antitoxin, Type IV TA system n=1 Tax=Amnibacterium kyonggiense TaxID=595671 RepID=A0A4R7FHV3_9MICO|nr:hypothetical protein [Amnibacterium kyonggiense]TDS75974.1 hypothetical protein CLV52_3089 [Amnibacterium kyonggiense]